MNADMNWLMLLASAWRPQRFLLATTASKVFHPSNISVNKWFQKDRMFCLQYSRAFAVKLKQEA